jgi:hypothetical protein
MQRDQIPQSCRANGASYRSDTSNRASTVVSRRRSHALTLHLTPTEWTHVGPGNCSVSDIVRLATRVLRQSNSAFPPRAPAVPESSAQPRACEMRSSCSSPNAARMLPAPLHGHAPPVARTGSAPDAQPPLREIELAATSFPASVPSATLAVLGATSCLISAPLDPRRTISQVCPIP